MVDAQTALAANPTAAAPAAPVDAFAAQGCCVLVPTYNNAVKALAEVLSGILEYTQAVIVVNDGSTDGTAEILSYFQLRHPALVVVSLPVNIGKGNALRTGFAKARQLGYRHVITIDSDGQHRPQDLPLMLDAIRRWPDAVIVGSRDMAQAGIPGKSSFGHKFSNFWYQFQTGINLPDTQSGYRAYPLAQIAPLKLRTNKFEFEIEVLVQSAWAGVPMRHQPITVIYPPKGERVSHFRPFQDFSRISILNIWYVILAIHWYIPRRVWAELRQQGWAKLRRQLLGSDESPRRRAQAVMLGVFLGLSPLWGYQLPLALLVGHLLKLNKFLAGMATQVSLPPLIPFILYGGLWVGTALLGQPMPPLARFATPDWALLQSLIGPYLLGSIVLAATIAVLAGGAVLAVIATTKPAQAAAMGHASGEGSGHD